MPTPTNRRTRNTAITVAIESSYAGSAGTYSPVLLVDVPDFQIDPKVVPRDLVRPWFGASEELAGTAVSILRFKTEIAAPSALGTAPEWGKLLRLCGMAETITPSTRVEYSLITDAPESGSLRFNRAGVQYQCKGARGTVSIDLTAYQRPMFDWTIMGFDTSVTESAIGTPSLTAWTRPLVITDANSGNIRLGGSYSGGAVTGGTAYNSRGMVIDLGNKLDPMEMLGGESVDITERNVTGSATFELTTADEVTWWSDIRANALTSMTFNIGGGGSNVIFHGPSVQRTKPRGTDYNGKQLMTVDTRYLPTSGNDELRIIVK